MAKTAECSDVKAEKKRSKTRKLTEVEDAIEEQQLEGKTARKKRRKITEEVNTAHVGERLVAGDKKGTSSQKSRPEARAKAAKSKDTVTEDAATEETVAETAGTTKDTLVEEMNKKEKKKKKKKSKTERAGGMLDGGAGEPEKIPTKAPKKAPKQAKNDDSKVDGVSHDRNDEDHQEMEEVGPHEAAQQEKREKFICFIGNLPFSATKADVEQHFRQLRPTSVRLLTERSSKPPRSRGIAFVEFDSYARMKTSLARLHHSDLTDATGATRRINVELTAGGGGAGAGRKDKIKAKNLKLNEERDRRRMRQAAEQPEPSAAKLVDGAHHEPPHAQEDHVHPSRKAWMNSAAGVDADTDAGLGVFDGRGRGQSRGFGQSRGHGQSRGFGGRRGGRGSAGTRNGHGSGRRS